MAPSSPAVSGVVIHPLVLLSVVDHYNRVARNTKKRVLGILLGQNRGGIVNVANSYARTYLLFAICYFAIRHG